MGRDQGVAAQGLPEIRQEKRIDQAAVRGREALRVDRWRRIRHVGCRPASDVGGAVLQVRQAAAVDQLRRPRHDGFRTSGGDGRAAGQSGRDGRLRDRRSVDPDVHPGAVDLQAISPADQDREPEQPLHGHGAAVAGVLLR